MQFFKNIIFLDFEFYAPPGNRPLPICMVAKNIITGDVYRLLKDELATLKRPPFPMDESTLLCAYYASAEFGCFMQLGWGQPPNILDLFAEFKNITNGLRQSRAGLLDALSWYGISGIGFAEKDEMRELAMRGGPWSSKELHDLLDYCETDVIALEKLYTKMLPKIDLPRALIRGQYMWAAAAIEHNGTPIDSVTLSGVQKNWPSIQEKLIQRVDAQYQVYEGTTFKQDKFSAYLIQNNIPWPSLPSGKLDLKDDTFRDMCKAYPQLSDLYQLRTSLGQMRSGPLPIGSDFRNRAMLSAFGSLTGRNQPSTKNFIFGRSSWQRQLIQPEPGSALAYIDYSQQEFGIAAALSCDVKMLLAYDSGDPYLEFAKMAGAIPADGTKRTHGPIREQFKQCSLAMLYGGGAKLVSFRTGVSVLEAQQLIRAHKRSYPIFWRWIQAAKDTFYLTGKINTVFGWWYYLGPQAKPGTILNFPMQANGAEILRLACCNVVAAGIKICAPIHDAILIEAPIAQIEEQIAIAQEIMAEASDIVLGGKLRLRSDVKLIYYPDRYVDERGVAMWHTIQTLLAELEGQKPAHECGTDVRMGDVPMVHECAPAQYNNISPISN